MSNPNDDRRGDLLGANLTTSIIALIALALRFWSRATSKKAGFWWDDWSALASAPFLIVICATTAWWVSLGLGLHVEQALTCGNPHQWLLILWIENLVYNTGLSLVKLSVVLFYFRVFRDVRLYKYALWAASFLVVGWCIGNNFLAIFECIPVQAYWQLTPRRCINNSAGFLGTTISNVVVDIVILLLPLPMLWRLHLDTKRRLALSGVFICGYCVVVVSIVRLASIVTLGNAMNEDLTWNFVNAQLMVSIEIPIALFSSCLPAIFQLTKRLLEKRRFGTAQSSKQLTHDNHVKMGPLGNPIDDPTYKNITRLQSQAGDSQSMERLYGMPEEYQLSYMANASRDVDAVDHNVGNPIHSIRVRKDVDVEASL